MNPRRRRHARARRWAKQMVMGVYHMTKFGDGTLYLELRTRIIRPRPIYKAPLIGHYDGGVVFYTGQP
jgi:hypothetical protein